ncbi:WxL domain-containing protein [Desertibacillus haloalkaliphilus]|uniref:WxL domain-containing protein n=1 Tax=Desertibacillus haloalkaliphilus TaxID=1328930 RepID=UPI001C2519A3|nr:WxL domain-containing protein [Desertibacillus haloalkaliphilus]MBU8906713.1 WxL domain-containing protein [Desertibacillus haloalkaliphilus]
MKKTIKKVFVSTAAVAMVMSTMATGAFANTTTGETSITGAENVALTVPTSVNFDVELDGKIQHVTTSLDPLTVVDARGTGLGWSIKLTSDKLKNDSRTLDKSSLRLINAPTINALHGSSSTNVDSGAGDLTGLGVTVASAPADFGMGTFEFAFGESLQLTLHPDETYAESYTTTLNWEILDAPIN